MGNDTYIRCVCDRCNRVEEISKTMFTAFQPYPKSWGKILKRHICNKCYVEFREVFEKFMENKK